MRKGVQIIGVIIGLLSIIMFLHSYGIDLDELEPQWQLLFVGKSLQGWINPDTQRPLTKGWIFEEDALKLMPARGDIITLEQFSDFELDFEWKISPGGNSGIKYFVVGWRGWHIGHEYQILDDYKQANNASLHGTGSFYDVVATIPNRPLKPAGQWNQSRIIVRGDKVEHWLNGVKVLEYKLGSPELLDRIKQSKFKSTPCFGYKLKGHLLVQDHGGILWLRNMKIRKFLISNEGTCKGREDTSSNK